MVTSQGELTAWTQFCDRVTSNNEVFADTPNVEFSRFSARYRAASVLTVSLPGYSDKGRTADGYADLLGVGMAYSALEALEHAIKQHDLHFNAPAWPCVAVSSAELAEAFRSDGAAKLRDAFDRHLTSKKLRLKVRALHDEGEDVAPLVAGFRHLAFHGVFTPGTFGYSRTVVRDLIRGLRTHTLLATDRHFTAWVNQA